MQSDDVELLAMPVSHSFGLERIRCALSTGQTMILLGSFVNAKKLHRDKDMLTTVGKYSPNVIIAVFNDDGTVVPDGIVGEICAKSDNVFYKKGMFRKDE